MKDNLIRFRVETAEKERIERDAKRAGYDDVSTYLLHLIRRNHSRLKK